MRLLLDTSDVVFLAGSQPEPVVDFTTKQPKRDRADRPLFQVRLTAFYKDEDGKDQSEVLTVKLTNPKPLPPMAPVRVSELVAIPWANNGRSGVAYRAAAVEPAPATSKAS
jgi:hypothetical protein